jgi:hypothetical protein
VVNARVFALVPESGLIRSNDSPSRDLRLSMNSFPADEQRISDVERGRSCRAIVPLPSGNSLSAGDTIVFALSYTHAGQQPSYVKGGDSVRVMLTDVADLRATDPVTGQALYQLSWEPLGQVGLPATTVKRVVKSSGVSPRA